ncbi:hypothetical protein [Pseudomonas sp. 6D_7.1_Bac1]|uniref:hypothetical protein n=1 Tax=Pseudomonas sp. 6D_7.1_Bac1 TaxID=2971615 RepID=UPI0021C62C81|nr:hypothetical protein [Pseudomonas sp. 6D_7.1_Bac1]MCU1750211.1 hypothetical protein [Pseudomonas sp. 6D_7.1_Bac1]
MLAERISTFAASDRLREIIDANVEKMFKDLAITNHREMLGCSTQLRGYDHGINTSPELFLMNTAGASRRKVSPVRRAFHCRNQSHALPLAQRQISG